MNKSILSIIVSILPIVMPLEGNAAPLYPIDLSSWSAHTPDIPNNGSPHGGWNIELGNARVEQTINGDATFFTNNLDESSYSIDGTLEVTYGNDDDYIGFVFGYQNSSNFYLFDWKGASESSAGVLAAEGMTVKRFTGTTGDIVADLSPAELWENQNDLGDMSIITSNHSDNAGWTSNTLYNFHLEFNLILGEIAIVVKQGSAELWAITFNDTTFSHGQFGFYSNSQANTRYASFEQTGNFVPQPVPEPATWMFIGMFLFCLALGKHKLMPQA